MLRFKSSSFRSFGNLLECCKNFSETTSLMVLHSLHFLNGLLGSNFLSYRPLTKKSMGFVKQNVETKTIDIRIFSKEYLQI